MPSQLRIWRKYQPPNCTGATQPASRFIVLPACILLFHNKSGRLNYDYLWFIWHVILDRLLIGMEQWLLQFCSDYYQRPGTTFQHLPKAPSLPSPSLSSGQCPFPSDPGDQIPWRRQKRCGLNDRGGLRIPCGNMRELEKGQEKQIHSYLILFEIRTLNGGLCFSLPPTPFGFKNLTESGCHEGI